MPGAHPQSAPHFTWAELGAPPKRLRANARRLATHLEELRRIIGHQAVPIISGYRSPRHNRAVGGAPHSQHLRAAAADIPYGLATVEQAMRAGFTGIGERDGWAVHVDVRPGPLTRFHDG